MDIILKCECYLTALHAWSSYVVTPSDLSFLMRPARPAPRGTAWQEGRVLLLLWLLAYCGLRRTCCRRPFAIDPGPYSTSGIPNRAHTVLYQEGWRRAARKNLRQSAAGAPVASLGANIIYGDVGVAQRNRHRVRSVHLRVLLGARAAAARSVLADRGRRTQPHPHLDPWRGVAHGHQGGPAAIGARDARARLCRRVDRLSALERVGRAPYPLPCSDQRRGCRRDMAANPRHRARARHHPLRRGGLLGRGAPRHHARRRHARGNERTTQRDLIGSRLRRGWRHRRLSAHRPRQDVGRSPDAAVQPPGPRRVHLLLRRRMARRHVVYDRPAACMHLSLHLLFPKRPSLAGGICPRIRPSDFDHPRLRRLLGAAQPVAPPA